MDLTLALSTASALAYAVPGMSGAIPANLPHVPVIAQSPGIRIVAPTIQLTALPVNVGPELEKVIYSSMHHDFERRYAL